MRMFKEAYVGSQGTVEREALGHIRKFTLDATKTDIFDFVCAGAYFQMMSGYLDLQFAIPLSEHAFLLRKFAGEICLSSLFGKCEEAEGESRCTRGLHPANNQQAFRWAYTIMMIQCPSHYALGKNAGDKPCQDQGCVFRHNACPCGRRE
eukprot:14065806-Alexandrium_andersonii.AAC.1